MTTVLSKQLSPEDIATSVPGDNLRNKSALITGGASGIGASIALKYALGGAYVTLVDIDETKGQQYYNELQSNGLKVQFIKADVTSWDDQLAAFKAAAGFSPGKSVDIVVASAGVFGKPFIAADTKPVSAEDDPVKPGTTALEINAIGSYYTSALAKHYFTMPSDMPSSPRCLILIASIAAYLDFPSMADYTASKYAVRGMFHTIRPIFSDLGLRVNLLAPWLVDTPLAVDTVKLFKTVGAPIGDLDHVYNAALYCAADSKVNGRAFACGPKRILDLGDDREGDDASKVMHVIYETEVPGWDVMVEGLK